MTPMERSSPEGGANSQLFHQAAQVIKSQAKSQLYLRRFQQCYRLLCIKRKYLTLYNRTMQMVAVQVLEAAADIKRKRISAARKRSIIRDQNTLLRMLENKLERKRRQLVLSSRIGQGIYIDEEDDRPVVIDPSPEELSQIKTIQ